jgi:hypothetical protein
MSTLVLIERTRVLVNDKISIFKEDYKKSIQTRKLNERKSGTLNTLKIIQLEKEMEEKKKYADKLEAEKEMMVRKVKNLKKSPDVNRRSSCSPSPRKNSESIYLTPDKLEEVSDNEDDDSNKIDSKKIYNKKNVIEDIQSDLENQSVKSNDFSDCTSMTSSASVNSVSDLNRQLDIGGLNRTDVNTSNLNDMSNMSFCNAPEFKRLYQEFVKIMLKVKFEKYHNSHKGQQISEKILFKECMRQNIPKKDWLDFIVNELKQPTKYAQQNTRRDTKLKNYKPYIG